METDGNLGKREYSEPEDVDESSGESKQDSDPKKYLNSQEE
jgi:hypothetical protein